MKAEPDYELDAYLHRPDERDLLCDVKIWLPHEPSADGHIQVVVMGVESISEIPRGLVSLIGDEELEAAGLKFKAEGVFIRQSLFKGRRKAGGVKLTITHVDGMRIETDIPSLVETTSTQGQLQWLQFILSDLSYACPGHSYTADYRGNRTARREEAMILRMSQAEEADCAFELERHWTWARDDNTRIAATSTPVLNLLDIKQHSQASTEELTSIADDTCVLLTLAARHLVVVHKVVSHRGTSAIEEWRNPLSRLRATDEEEACGPLIDASNLKGYFLKASIFWKGLDARRRDAIRLAIFSVHPFTSRTLEGGLLAMFSALEGLARCWGTTSGTTVKKLQTLLKKHPARIVGLWPLLDTHAKPGLACVRNQLAHGNSIGRFPSGMLSLAHDHLQLWLEHVLLAMMAYPHQRHGRDWLSGQVESQRPLVSAMQEALKEQCRVHAEGAS